MYTQHLKIIAKYKTTNFLFETGNVTTSYHKLNSNSSVPKHPHPHNKNTNKKEHIYIYICKEYESKDPYLLFTNLALHGPDTFLFYATSISYSSLLLNLILNPKLFRLRSQLLFLSFLFGTLRLCFSPRRFLLPRGLLLLLFPQRLLLLACVVLVLP